MRKNNIILLAINFAIIFLIIVINIYIRSQTVIAIDDVNGSSIMQVTKKYAEHFDLLTTVSLSIIIGFMLISMFSLIIDNLHVNKRLNVLVDQFSDIGLSRMEDNNPVLTEYDKTIIEAWNRSVSEVEELNHKRDSYFKHMMHDLKIPLQLMSMNIEMIKEEINDCEYVYDLEEEMSSLNSAVVNFLFIEKISYFEKANKKDVNINAYFECIKKRYESFGYDIEIVENQQRETIYADEAMLSRIVENLMENAMKHGSDGTIKIKIDDQRIEVINNINSVDQISDIYNCDRFFSVSGNGLGVEIVNTYVRLLGWNVFSTHEANEFKVTVELTDS